MVHTARHVWPDAASSSWRLRRDALECNELTTAGGDRKMLKVRVQQRHRGRQPMGKRWRTR